MTAGYARTFVVAAPVERAWQAFVDPRQREAWIAPPGHDVVENPAAQFPEDGCPPIEVKLGDVELHRRLSWSVGQTMPSGSRTWLDVCVTFEAVDAGTRVTLTRSSPAASDEGELLDQCTRMGLDQELTDLIAYLETGVNVSRHFASRSSIGASLRDTPAGLCVAQVIPGGFAAQAGLQTGDLLVSIGGAGTYTRSDISFLQRERDPGEELEVTAVRDGALLRFRARLSERYYTETHGGIGV
jgi:uncharacterized protein YndB with AHSA1/START domain